jgi:uncharacterized RDD family membrane protein YckC
MLAVSGYTPGKYLCRLRICGANGKVPRLRAALVRELAIWLTPAFCWLLLEGLAREGGTGFLGVVLSPVIGMVLSKMCFYDALAGLVGDHTYGEWKG